MPHILVLANITMPFWTLDFIGSSTPDADFTNHHFWGWWMWLFLVPYAVLFLYRNNNNLFLPTKLAVCNSAAVSFLNPFFPAYNLPWLLLVVLLTGGAMWGLYWKPTKKTKTSYGKFPLVLDPYGEVGIPTASLHENVQIVGGTGTGKTHFVIKPFIEQTIRQDLGCFILDVKSNMLRDVAYYAFKAPGRFVRHFNLVDILKSHTYNSLYGDNPDAIANRAFAALYYDSHNAEPYYRDLAEVFLHNLIGLLKLAIKTITFQDLLTATQEVETFRTIAWFCAKYPNTHYARYFRDQWLSKSPKDRRMELSGLINKLQRFCNSEWSHLLNVREPDIKMSEVVRYGQIFLFSPDYARYPEDAKPLCILAMMDLAEQLADRYRAVPEKPFRVFLDEFYNLAYPKFIDFINKCREAQVNLFLAHQSMGDLRGVSQEFLEQVMNTASNKIILRVNDPDTAEGFARQFGTERDPDYRVESFGTNGDVIGYSKPPVEKFRFHPNRIKELKVGQAIVKVVGESGVKVFQTSLRPADPPWDYFTTQNGVAHRPRRNGTNESSIPELVGESGGGPEPGPKNPGSPMGDENAA